MCISIYSQHDAETQMLVTNYIEHLYSQLDAETHVETIRTCLFD
jgi:hypothetical protein